MILDSNIIIYAVKPVNVALRTYLFDSPTQLCVSLISKVEVLGYHQLGLNTRSDFENFFQNITLFPITESVINEAVRLRQQRKRSLGDSIIAATALVYNLPLLTNNDRDFTDVTGLRVIPLASIQ